MDQEVDLKITHEHKPLHSNTYTFEGTGKNVHWLSFKMIPILDQFCFIFLIFKIYLVCDIKKGIAYQYQISNKKNYIHVLAHYYNCIYFDRI